MRTITVLCALLALVSCAEKPLGGGDTNSPIIISDGSTKLHHKKPQQSKNTVTVAEAKTSITLQCPKNKGFACDDTPLVPTWTLTVYDSSKNPIATISSPDNVTVTADFGANTITAPQLDFDTENFLGKFVATQDSNLTIHYFMLANGTGGNSVPMTMCANTKPCRIKLI